MTCFIGGLKLDIQPLVQWANPQSLLEVYQCAKLHEQSFNFLYKQLSQFSHKFTYTTNKPLFSVPPAQSHQQSRMAQVVKTKATTDKNLSFEECKERNLCYKCYYKYAPGHQCKPKMLHAMEREEFCDTQEELIEPVQDVGPEAQNQGELSLMVLLGHSKSPSTIKIIGWAKKQRFLVLIECGSTIASWTHASLNYSQLRWKICLNQ